MRSIIFLSLGLLVTAVVVSGASTTVGAKSDEPIRGTVSNIYGGAMIAITGYGSNIRLTAISSEPRLSIPERQVRQSLSALIKGKPVSCKKGDIDNYGTVEARCWTDTGTEITGALVRKAIVKAQ